MCTPDLIGSGSGGGGDGAVTTGAEIFRQTQERQQRDFERRQQETLQEQQTLQQKELAEKSTKEVKTLKKPDEREERRRRVALRSRTRTILTSGAGLQEPAFTRPKTLLGT